MGQSRPFSENIRATDGRLFQIESDGRTVWVNSDTGMNVGRLSKTGLDIHKDYDEQMEGGHCLSCAASSGVVEFDWALFAAGMKIHYGLDLPDHHMPASVGFSL